MGFRDKLSGWRPRSKSRTSSPSNVSTPTESGVGTSQTSTPAPHDNLSLNVAVPPTISVTSPTPSTPLPPPIPSPADREIYGLIDLVPSSSQGQSSATSPTATYPIDIIAVHGLRGNAFSTWTSPKTKFFWLQDSLPKVLPGARIFSFGYRAEIISRETGGFNDFARELLLTLSQERTTRDLQRRPIVFICHSMGGIVVKRALVITKIEEDQFSDIREQTKAILFMATPHRGSGSATLGGIAADVLGLPLPKGVFNARSDLIKSLRKDSKELENITTDFRLFAKSIKFYSFIEKSITQYYGRVIVDNVSGKLDAVSEELIMMNGCDHQSICRFESDRSASYKMVMGVLEKVAKELTIHFIREINAEDKPCLASFSFPSMNDRYIQTGKAHPSTCVWILSQPLFASWQSSDRGLLWIKGHPGSGKSTLMAFIYSRYLDLPTHSQAIHLDFFFHGNGTTLQKSSLGMFRSLLHQLYKQSLFARPIILDAFKEKTRDFGEHWEWQVEELQVLLSDIISRLPTQQEVIIFVDALDEAMDEGVRAAGKLVLYFHALNDRVAEVGGSTRICISCRHHPILATRAGLEIRMQEENREDIAKYVRWHLESGVERWMSKPEAVRRGLEHTIVQKADGVFLWASLRIQTIIQNLNDGFYTVENMQQLIERESNELFPLYKSILTKVLDIKATMRRKALLFMQWVCLAERPLSVEELRYAMACDKDSVFQGQKRCEDSGDFILANETMEQLTKSLSGGLAEIRHHGGRSTVQLFHQTVREFMFENGLKALISLCRDGQEITNKEVFGQSEDRLAKSCINYFKMEDLWDIPTLHSPKEIKKEFEFSEYATYYWLLHAERAEDSGISQSELKEIFEACPNAFTNWKRLSRVLGTPQHLKPPNGESKLIHVAASSNLVTLCNALLDQGIPVDEKDGMWMTPLNLAAKSGYVGLTKRFIDLGADIEIQGIDGRTPLELAAGSGREAIVKLLLEAGSDVNKKTGTSGTALHAAASRGDIRTVKFLIENGADVDLESGMHGTALQEALYGGHEDVAQYLLKSGADLNFSGGYYGSPFQAAIRAKGNVQQRLRFAKNFLDAGVDVNIKGGHYGNALQAAAAGFENYDLIQLLLNRGADVNARGGHFGFALQAACDTFIGTYETVNLLLSSGAEVNARGGRYGTALQAAAFLGELGLVKFLVDFGADINLQGGIYGTALQAAVVSSNQDLVQFLLENGAKIMPGGQHGTVLRAAALAESKEMVKIFLERGIGINDKGGRHESILASAISMSRLSFIEFLLDCGADTNDEDQTALEAAVCFGKKEVVKLLLERGVDVWQVGRSRLRYTSSVHFAAKHGMTEMLNILLNSGNVDMHGNWYESALDAAKCNGYNGVVRLLEEKRGAATRVQLNE